MICRGRKLVSPSIFGLSRAFSGMPLTHQSYSGRKRFYKSVDIERVDGSDEYKITLDHRTLRTPARTPLHLKSPFLASMIALEWDSQSIDDSRGIQPASMPLMTLVCTAIDQVAVDRATAIQTCLKYLPTDTALFWTTDEDRILLKKQRQAFQPIIRWMKKSLGIDLLTTQAMVSKLAHPVASTEKLRWILEEMDPLTLTCVQAATMECKSLVLAMALLGRHITVDQARAASRLEEEFQVEIWGCVEGGHDMDRLNNTISLSSVGCCLDVLRSKEEVDKLISHWNTFQLDSNGSK